MEKTKEEIFLDKIDCRFPHQNRDECIKLIEAAAFISTNALFAVVEEICRIPVSDKKIVPNAVLWELLEIVSDKINHPLKEMIIETAGLMIDDKDLSVDEAIARMEIVEHYHQQYSALSILYFSSDDVEERLEPVWDRIITKWHAV